MPLLSAWLLTVTALAPAGAVGVSAPPLSAQDISVKDLLARADAVRALGPLAAESEELAAMKRDIARIARGYRTMLTQSTGRGEPPHSCPPPRSGLTSSDLFGALGAVPPEKRAEMGVSMVYAELMKKRYPCA